MQSLEKKYKGKLTPEETIKLWQQRSESTKDPLAKVMWPDRPIWNIYMDNLQSYYLKPYIQNIKKSAKVLDVGCGIGRFTFRFAKFGGEVYGIDISEENINYAIEKMNREKYDNVKFMVMDVRRLKFDDETFDYVFSIGVLCQVTNKGDFRQAISELLRVMKRGGKMILLENTGSGENYISIPKKEWFQIIEESGGKIKYWCGIDIPLLRKVVVELPFAFLCKLITRRGWKVEGSLLERDKKIIELYGMQSQKNKAIENFIMKILTNILKPFEYTIPKFFKSQSKYILIEVTKKSA